MTLTDAQRSGDANVPGSAAPPATGPCLVGGRDSRAAGQSVDRGLSAQPSRLGRALPDTGHAERANDQPGVSHLMGCSYLPVCFIPHRPGRDGMTGVQRFTPLLIDAAWQCRHVPRDRQFVVFDLRLSASSYPEPGSGVSFVFRHTLSVSVITRCRTRNSGRRKQKTMTVIRHSRDGEVRTSWEQAAAVRRTVAGVAAHVLVFCIERANGIVVC
jgi:hypothetical protein